MTTTMTILQHAATALCVLFLLAYTATLTPSTAQPVNPVIAIGDTFCIEGYVMDSYCIDRGTLLDRPSIVTLEQPDQHSIHCLVDVGPCVNSHYEILTPGSTMYNRGFRITQETKPLLIDVARSVGTSCSTCDGGGTQLQGFRAVCEGTVVALQDGEIPPTISVTAAFDSNSNPSGACQQYFPSLVDASTLLPPPPDTLLPTVPGDEGLSAIVNGGSDGSGNGGGGGGGSSASSDNPSGSGSPSNGLASTFATILMIISSKTLLLLLTAA